MFCRRLRGESVLAIPPWNLVGLLVRNPCRSVNRQIPFGSVSAITLSIMLLDGTAESEGVRALGPESVVIELERIPVVEVSRTPADSAGEVGNAATDQNLGRGASRKRGASYTQISPGCIGIDRFQALIVVDRFVVAANADGVREARREDMSLLQSRRTVWR